MTDLSTQKQKSKLKTLIRKINNEISGGRKKLKDYLKEVESEFKKADNPYSPSKNPIGRAYKKAARRNIRRLDERKNKVFTDLEAGADEKRKASKNISKVSKSLRPKIRPKKND